MSSNNEINNNNGEIITASLVPEEGRLSFLPKNFPGVFHNQYMMSIIEQSIYSRMSFICPEYDGGYWDFYSLSNGGCFMSPDSESKLKLINPDNYFEGDVTSVTAGIITCLLVYSSVAFITNDQNVSNHFHLLQEFTFDHPEFYAIHAAID